MAELESRSARALRPFAQLSADPREHRDITGLFFVLALRAGDDEQEQDAGTFTFHIPACMRAYKDTCLGLVWRGDVPHLELRGAIWASFPRARVKGATGNLVPLLAHPRKFNASFNVLLNWLHKDAKREVAPQDTTGARPSVAGSGKFTATDGSVLVGGQLKKAMANPHLAPPANTPAWWTPAWWAAWAAARPSPRPSPRPSQRPSQRPSPLLRVPAALSSDDEEGEEGEPQPKRHRSPVPDLPPSLRTVADILRCMPGDDLPVPTWLAHTSRADAILRLVRNLGPHGGVLVAENKDNADIHAIVYKNLGMPVHRDAPAHMHQILLLQRWLDRNCEPTPVPDTST